VTTSRPPKSKSVTSDDLELLQHLRWQTHNHGSELLKEARAYELAGSLWARVSWTVGLPAFVLSALAGISIVSENELIAGILAALVTALTAINAFAKPNERATQLRRRSETLRSIGEEHQELHNTRLLRTSFDAGAAERLLSRLREDERKEKKIDCPPVPERIRLKVSRLVTNQKEDPLTDALKGFAPADTGEIVRDLRNQMDPALAGVFGEYVSDLLRRVENAVGSRKVILQEGGMLADAYVNTLQAFPGSTFFATSRPSRRYFWGNPIVMEAVESFIKGGGKMKRIFIVYGAEELHSQEAIEVIESQRRMGIEVYSADREKIPDRLNRLVLVEDMGRIGWEVFTDEKGIMRRVEATSDPELIAEYKDTFAQLLDWPDTSRYKPPT
jgi:hypothetical protein